MPPFECSIQGNFTPACTLSKRKSVHEALYVFEPLRNVFPAMIKKGPAAPVQAFLAVPANKPLNPVMSAVSHDLQ